MKLFQIVLIASTVLAAQSAIVLKCERASTSDAAAFSSATTASAADVAPADNRRTATESAAEPAPEAAAAVEAAPEPASAAAIDAPTPEQAPAPEAPSSEPAGQSPSAAEPAPEATQAAPEPAAAAAPSGASTNFAAVPGGLKGTAKTTRYWDCCKPSCANRDKGPLVGQLKTVNLQGKTVADPDAVSGCIGGDNFMDLAQAPRVVNDQLAFAYVAARVQSKAETETCGKCFKLSFTSTAAAGQTMIVQVTNTGADLGGDHFDIGIPGGGLGIFDGCSKQFTGFDGGARFGGISSAEGCSQLPEPMREGCLFRFNWFKGADNPSVDYEEVECPAEITEVSGVKRA